MPRKGLYLTFEKATAYLAAAGIDPSALAPLPHKIISGSLKQPMYCFQLFDIQALARKHKLASELPAIEQFLSKDQLTRFRDSGSN